MQYRVASSTDTEFWFHVDGKVPSKSTAVLVTLSTRLSYDPTGRVTNWFPRRLRLPLGRIKGHEDAQSLHVPLTLIDHQVQSLLAAMLRNVRRPTMTFGMPFCTFRKSVPQRRWGSR